MSKTEDEIHLARCLERIESKLNRGGRDGWSNYDFERLIDEIYQATGVRLSLTTLKRVSGRIKYDSFPTHTTLNALARYIGFNDWRDFTHRESVAAVTGDPKREANGNGQNAIEPESSDHPFSDNAPATSRRFAVDHRIRRVAFWLSLAVPMTIALYSLVASRKKQNLDKSLFSFRADKAYSTGVPNSVVFHYDATAIESDSVFIVQTWDISRKVLVPRDAHEHSAIYYYPGYFRTKLIVDGEIVKTHDLQIASDGWLCMAEQGPRPLYFTKSECESGDSITVGLPVLEKYNLSLHPDPPRIRIFNERDMGSLANESFVFETQLKNTFSEGSNQCQFVSVLIQGKDDIMMIPLSAKACVGDLSLYAFGYGVDSKHADLSGFGCDLSQWTTLRVETKNKHAKFFVNGKMAYELDFPNGPVGIVGVQYRLFGTAAIRGTRFESGGETFDLNQQSQ